MSINTDLSIPPTKKRNIKPKKEQVLTLSIRKLKNKDCQLITDVNRSLRIFRNIQTKKLVLIPVRDAKKGKSPILGHQLVISLDIVYSKQDGLTYLLHKPEQQIYFSLNKITYNQNKNGYKIQQGDNLMFGSLKINVLLVKKGNQQIKYDTKSSQILHQNHNVHGICRKCLKSLSKYQDDFLIYICSCKYSVHYHCLREQLLNYNQIQKFKSKRDNLNYSVLFQRFHCVLCKKPYPKCIIRNINGQITIKYLFQFQFQANKAYLVFSYSKYWFCMAFQQSNLPVKKQIFQRCDDSYAQFAYYVKSNISYKDGNFYLTNIVNPYGIRVKLQKDLAFNKIIYLTIGKHLFKFIVKQRNEEDLYKIQ